jgi:arsenate reductase
MTLKIYHNPRCSKSRQTLEIIKEKNLNLEIILYLEKGLEVSEIKEILQLLKNTDSQISIGSIIRKNEIEYKENNLSDKNLNEEELINIISKFPKLLERPIVINGKKAKIGRPPEDILEIL